MNGKRELLDDELMNVSGGAGIDSADVTAVKQREFDVAWNNPAYASVGYTSHQSEELFDKWRRSGFQGTAADFLKRELS